MTPALPFPLHCSGIDCIDRSDVALTVSLSARSGAHTRDAPVTGLTEQRLLLAAAPTGHHNIADVAQQIYEDLHQIHSKKALSMLALNEPDLITEAIPKHLERIPKRRTLGSILRSVCRVIFRFRQALIPPYNLTFSSECLTMVRELWLFCD
uniref:Uncharacterized protein n=1 Tax=Knipowitschia caucasica TaxID=637954 RepID=A0AAV2JHD6_KNICA